MRRVALAAVLSLLVLLPVACGDQEAAYCDALSKKQTAFSADAEGLNLVARLSTFQELGKKAPDDLTDEWQVFVAALQTLDTAIRAAGLDPNTPVGDKQPAGVSDAAWASLKAAADGVDSEAVNQAVSGIDQQAKDVCKLQLGL